MNVGMQATVKQMVEAIVREVDPEQVYLFGSVAREESRDDSDIDLLVVEQNPFGPERSRLQETNRIYTAVSAFRVPTDVLLYSKDELSKWSESANHVIGRCMREGRLVYARS
jgi:uncharacterized protein